MQKRLGKWLAMICLIAVVSPFSSAQIDAASLNEKLLENEIKTLIDSVRIAHKLPILYNDSILYVAAKHHANYLVKKGALSHDEPEDKRFFTPQDRALSYGASANYLVGENVVFTPYNARVNSKGKVFETDSYREIARCLVHSWVNSKGHFKNIVTPDYQVTGLAIAVDPKTGRIYAVQKFAQVMYTYDFAENKTFFPYSNLSADSLKILTKHSYPDTPYPFGLKDDKTEQCEECREAWEKYPMMSVRISKNYFVLRIEDDDFVKSLIKNKHDGFAIEIVSFDPFACGNPAYEEEPSRRNKMKRTSGRMLEPVYQKDLMKGFKKRKKVKNLSFIKYIFTADSISFFKRFGSYKLAKFSAKYFEIKLGKVPKDLNGWWNHNLVYVHNKQICHVLFLTNYPGKLNTEIVSVDYIPPVPINNYDFKLEYYSDTLELFYESGKTETTGTGLKKLIKQFEEKNLTVKSVEIEGFCSVEGDPVTNDRLHKERAGNILNEIKVFTDSLTKYEVTSQVAWDHFYANVKDHPKWKSLYKLSHDELSAYLANPKNEKPTDILAKERKVVVRVVAVRLLTPKTANYYVTRDLKNLFYKDSGGKLQCRSVDTLQRLYEKAFYLSMVDTLSPADFLKIKIPEERILISHNFGHELAFYPYHHLRSKGTKAELELAEGEVEAAFTTCGAADHLTPEFHYLTGCLIAEKVNRLGPKNTSDNPLIQKAFDRLSLLLTSYELDSSFYLNVAKANLNLIYGLCMAIGPDEMYKYNDVINYSLIQIVEYYRKANLLTPKKVVLLAQTLCFFHNVPLAVALCRDFLYDDEVLKVYLPLAYTHSSYLSGVDVQLFEADFHRLLMEARTRFTPEDWCHLFYGEFGIPFQVMDNAGLRTEFCKTCPNRVEEVFEEFNSH